MLMGSTPVEKVPAGSSKNPFHRIRVTSNVQSTGSAIAFPKELAKQGDGRLLVSHISEWKV